MGPVVWTAMLLRAGRSDRTSHAGVPAARNLMQEISRAILLPPPSPPQRRDARLVQGEVESEAPRGTGRQASDSAQNARQAFLTLVESRREDTVELRGKQFRFRPYGNRGVEENAREAGLGRGASGTDAIGLQAEEPVSVEILDGFGTGARRRNSSAFIASFIAQERLQQGLHNPPFEAASLAYRRAGGSPSAPDHQARVVSFAV